MSSTLASKLDPILQKLTDEKVSDQRQRIPLVVAGVTDKDKTLYLGSSGLKDTSDPNSKISNDTRIALYSTSKALTVTALFQLLERGKIDSLDDPVEKYVPDIKEIKVIESFENDTPVLKDPKKKVTVRHLVTHTAGFAYAFFDYDYYKLQSKTGSPSILKSEWSEFKTPLIFEPGTKWEYGTNIDWVGKVVQNVSGKTLDEYLKENVFKPLGITTLTFRRTKDQLKNQAKIHSRDSTTGELTPFDELHPLEPSFHAGGHGLFGTVDDYLKFLRIFLNEGSSNGVQILKPETVRNFFLKDQLVGEFEGIKVKTLHDADPSLTNEVNFSPTSSWTAAFQVDSKELPTGRSAGSFNWAGLTNIYYWIDVNKGIAGYYASQFFPFFDKAALQGFADFETATYEALGKK